MFRSLFIHYSVIWVQSETDDKLSERRRGCDPQNMRPSISTHDVLHDSARNRWLCDGIQTACEGLHAGRCGHDIVAGIVSADSNSASLPFPTSPSPKVHPPILLPSSSYTIHLHPPTIPFLLFFSYLPSPLLLPPSPTIPVAFPYPTPLTYFTSHP